MSEDRNPYNSDTPEWQLFERMKSLEAQARAFAEDADRFARKAAACREQAVHWRAALAAVVGEGDRKVGPR